MREQILRLTMSVALSAFCLVIWATSVTAQTKSEEKKPGDSPSSTGRTVLPDNKGQLQPQGWTGPLDTEGGRRTTRESARRHAAAHAACAWRRVQVHCRSLATRALKTGPRGPVDMELTCNTDTETLPAMHRVKESIVLMTADKDPFDVWREWATEAASLISP
jgi:hypothetical protein